ncbi:protein pelota isoform X2 [Linepithema humile]|uniref:protein pelota isoform X2 n=1 Tax=Linepithema humile TaxID=83485 RepID=UPI00351E7CBE
MKLVSKNVDKDGEGSVSLVPANTEDIWHAYNLISEGDSVSCSTFRKVQTESATGSSNSYRVRTTLTISVENIDFDTQACVLRLKGRNVEENKYVKTGAYHTLDVEQNRKFTIIKAKWDSISLERVDTACDPTQNADVAAAIMQEGIAQICLITSNMTIVRAKIDQVIPRKRKGNVSQHEKGLTRFYESIMQGILRHINFDLVKCVILASPGFVKDQFMDYMIQQAVKSDNKIILENKSKFLLVHTSSGFKHSLKEILADPAVVSRISDTKAAGEVRALEAFYTTLQMDPARAFYGKKHVQKASAAQAVETLLISDKLFRCQDIALRKEYVELVENVKDSGGDVKIFSSLHVSGEQLDQLTGIAALLRFPMPELEDENNDDKSDNEEEKIDANDENNLSSGSDEENEEEEEEEEEEDDNNMQIEKEKEKEKKQAQLQKKKKMKVQTGEIVKENPWEKAQQERQEYRLREKMIKKKHRKLYKSMMKGRQDRAKQIWLLRKKRRVHDTKEKEKRKEQRKANMSVK